MLDPTTDIVGSITEIVKSTTSSGGSTIPDCFDERGEDFCIKDKNKCKKRQIESDGHSHGWSQGWSRGWNAWWMDAAWSAIQILGLWTVVLMVPQC